MASYKEGFAIFEGKHTEDYIVVVESPVVYLAGNKEGFAVVEGKHTEVYMAESPVIYLAGNKEGFAVIEGKHTEVYMAESLVIYLASNKEGFAIVEGKHTEVDTVVFEMVTVKECDPRRFLRSRLMKNKRMHIAIVSAHDKIITISRQEFCHGSSLPKEDGRVVDPLSLGGPCHAIAAYLSQGGAVLPYDEGHGGAEGGGGRGGREEYLRYRGTIVVTQQSTHHRRSNVYESDKKRDVGPKAYPRVKCIDMDVVQMIVVMKCEPAELAVELDMPGVPLSHAMDSETEVRCYFDNVKEEVLAVQESSSSLSSCLACYVSKYIVHLCN